MSSLYGTKDGQRQNKMQEQRPQHAAFTVTQKKIAEKNYLLWFEKRLCTPSWKIKKGTNEERMFKRLSSRRMRK